MPSVPALNSLEAERLTLRRQKVSDAAIYRQLWTERDVRVPPHRQIDPEGRPTEEDIAEKIRDESQASRPGLLAVERKVTRDVIGYCGFVFNGKGLRDEPELAFELLRAVHNQGYATEASRAVILWAGESGYRRLWATVWDWNVASRRVLEKLGFREASREASETAHANSLLMLLEF
jgi:ribosomal-protein-alanine N-acetyltransferase